MANKRSETIKRTPSFKIQYIVYKRISYILFAGLLVVGFILGRVTKPTETIVETEEVVKTVEVPVEVNNSLPADYEVDYFNVPLSHSLQQYIYEICADNDLSVSLVIALIDQESNFNPECVSDTNDYGLMQINECNFQWIKEYYNSVNMFNPYQNVYCGINILAGYLHKYDDDYTKALMCYNLGEYGASKAWENGIFCTEYTKAIETKWEEYKNGSSDETR